MWSSACAASDFPALTTAHAAAIPPVDGKVAGQEIAVRLADNERSLIAAAVAAEFGPDARLLLFGSRTDDARHGGDIDLFIDGVALDAGAVLQRKLELLLRLHDALGERRIDVVVARACGPDLPVHRHARQTGVPLWP